MKTWARQICAAVLFLGITLAQAALANPVEDDTAAGSDGDTQDENPEANATKREPHSFYDVVRAHPFAFEAQLGPWGSPTGVLGLAADVSVLPALALYAGAGVGGSGVQWAVGLRPRVAVEKRFALTTTLSFSQGNFQPVNLEFTMRDRHFPADMGRTSWVNADVGPEYRGEDGLLIRGSLGYSKAIRSEHPAGTYYLGEFTPAPMPGFVYFAFAVGLHSLTP